jgi:hypothetical protein
MMAGDEAALRRAIFRRALPLFGRIVSPSQIRDRDPETGQQLHPLIEGIYKPRWSRYALSIPSMLASPLLDRSWIYYSPKTGDLAIASNRALFQCMEDTEPVLVFRQETDKRSCGGSSYRVLGLGLIEEFEPRSHLFKIRGLHFDEIETYLAGRQSPTEQVPDDLLDTALRLESLESWAPFVQESRAVYRVNPVKLEAAFRRIVLEDFQNTCAVTGQKFVYRDVVEAEAAHIIGKEVSGLMIQGTASLFPAPCIGHSITACSRSRINTKLKSIPKHSRRIASCFHFSGKKERPSICRLIAVIDRTRKPSNGTGKSTLVGSPASGTEDSKAAADE